MNEWTNEDFTSDTEWTNELEGEPMNARVNEWTREWINEQTSEPINAWVNQRTWEWINELGSVLMKESITNSIWPHDQYSSHFHHLHHNNHHHVHHHHHQWNRVEWSVEAENLSALGLWLNTCPFPLSLLDWIYLTPLLVSSRCHWQPRSATTCTSFATRDSDASAGKFCY